LVAPLDGFYRLRMGGHRIVYRYCAGPAIQLEYADLRDVVYEDFLQRLRSEPPAAR
jgi:hypothetical protein